jgi:hypothetical protein
MKRGIAMESQPVRLLDQVRTYLRRKHYSLRTEKAYVSWIRRYILFRNKRHPRTVNKSHLEAILTHLAVDRKVAASTQPVLAGQAREPSP